MNFTDAHCHIHFNSNALSKSDDLLNHRFCVCAVDENDSPKVLKAAKEHKNIVPFIGIHPKFLTAGYKAQLQALETLLKNNKTGIGETGLDFRNKDNKEDQIFAFTAQIETAQRLKRPAAVHCVHAIGKVIEVLNEIKPDIKILFHNLNQSQESMRLLLKFNSYFSAGPLILQGKGNSETLKYIPEDRLLFETDYDGKTEYEPQITIPLIIEHAAKVLGKDKNKLAQQAYKNSLNYLEGLI